VQIRSKLRNRKLQSSIGGSRFLTNQRRGFHQYCTPVASLSSVPVVQSIPAATVLEIYQIDVVKAFMGSRHVEQVDVSLPEGILSSTRVASLHRSLYRLKQLPRYWYTGIHTFLISEMGFHFRQFNCCIYTDKQESILALYIDDIVITGTSKNIHHMHPMLKAKFEIVALEPVIHFLGMVITRK